MMIEEPTMIGLSERGHAILGRMKEDGQIGEMADGYRLGIALALASGQVPPDVPAPRKTVFSVATIDPEGDLAAAIRALAALDGSSVYKMAERLADSGVRELEERFGSGVLDSSSLLRRS